VRVALLAAVYLGAAKLGLTMAAVSLFVFAGPTTLVSFHPLACTVFPLGNWAALWQEVETLRQRAAERPAAASSARP